MSVSPVSPRLEVVPIPDDLLPGARNALRTCLALQEKEELLLVIDEECLSIGGALLKEARALGARCNAFVLEDLAPRPHQHMPEPILEALARCQVSILTVVPQRGEIQSRRSLTQGTVKYGIRHAHMVGVTPEIMAQSMRADYQVVADLSHRLADIMRQAGVVHITAPGGTDLVATFSPTLRWVVSGGLIRPGEWENLPAGEVFSCPATVDGVFVVDGALGDWLGPKYGDIRRTPLTLSIKDGFLRDARCDNRELLKDYIDYVHACVAGNRVGEVGIGTNLAISEPIGQLLQDEKIPGAHIAMGNPFPGMTGADWSAESHIDGIARYCTIEVDGVRIMESGAFLI